MPIKVYISLGYVKTDRPSIFSPIITKYTYAFKRIDGLIFIGGIEASGRKDAEQKIRRRHLVEFGELAGNDIPALKSTFEIKEIVKCGKS